LFRATPDNSLYPNPQSYGREESQLELYEFLGRVLGKALYEGILVELNFALFFLSKWLGRRNYFDDLLSLDPELYQGLLYVKNHSGNVQDLSLNFSIDENEFGVTRAVDLIPRGREVALTNENRARYVHAMANYKVRAKLFIG
jgi:ubiquitin-protein ligase E3 C